MRHGLIGYTGFVGSTLLRQTSFDGLYNSKNIATIAGEAFDLVVCAGAPAEKWKANQQPESDWENLQGLMGHLRTVRTAELILISSVDVYPTPSTPDEGTPVEPEMLDPYGKHRARLEQFCLETFPRATVVRLPGLFGVGMKKNFLFDLIGRGSSEWTHHASRFQFYDMARLWSDLNTVRAHEVNAVNFATEPVRAGDVAERCFGIAFTNETAKPPVAYDVRTKYAGWFGALPESAYITTADETYTQIKRFVQAQKSAQGQP